MQVNRLFEMMYLLIEHGRMTAAELAARFEVSTRTIYRDVDVLSGAGIPVYAAKGKGGGIRLLPGFVLSRSMLSRAEQNQLLASLQGLRTLQVPDADLVLEKLSALFGLDGSSWLEMDFSPWGSGLCERERFELLRQAVQEHRVVRFLYSSMAGEQTAREVEPLKILFKAQSWYVYAYCRTREDSRLFKLNRMDSVALTGERFTRDAPLQIELDIPEVGKRLHMRLRISAALAYRVWDEFSREQISRLPSGDYSVELDVVEDDWLYSFLLSFGADAEVLEPAELRQQMWERVRQLAALYQKEPAPFE